MRSFRVEASAREPMGDAETSGDGAEACSMYCFSSCLESFLSTPVRLPVAYKSQRQNPTGEAPPPRSLHENASILPLSILSPSSHPVNTDVSHDSFGSSRNFMLPNRGKAATFNRIEMFD